MCNDAQAAADVDVDVGADVDVEVVVDFAFDIVNDDSSPRCSWPSWAARLKRYHLREMATHRTIHPFRSLLLRCVSRHESVGG